MDEKEYESKMAKIVGSTDIKEVSLNDEIEVGCTNCGGCCMRANVNLNAYDVFNISKHKEIISDKIEEFISYRFGDESGLPIISIKMKNNGMCPFLKISSEGDFVCALGDDKPLSCTHPYIAVAVSFKTDEFNYVSVDKEIVPESFDPDKYLNDYGINDSVFYYLNSRKNTCSAPKNKMKLSEYLAPYIEKFNENRIAGAIPFLISKYIDIKRFVRLMYLAEFSDKNVPLIGNDTFNAVMSPIFTTVYLYASLEEGYTDENFVSKTKEHIDNIQKKLFMKYRLLSHFLIEAFSTSNKSLLTDILDMENHDEAQERFDNYFEENKNILKEKVFEVFSSLEKVLKEAKVSTKGEDNDTD